MKSLQYILIAGFFLVSNTFLRAQEEWKESSVSISFTIVEMKDKSLFIGKIIEENDTLILLHDNLLGRITLNKQNITTIDNENLNDKYVIELINGNQLSGYIIDKQEHYFSIRDNSIGLVNIRPEYITKIQRIEDSSLHDNSYRFPNPNATRYLFAPSAIPLQKGEGYYQNAWVLANSANYGVTNNLSLGGGVLLPVAAYITPKIGVKVTRGLYVAAGALVGLLPEQTVAGIGYGLLTFGNTDNNITLGTGYGFVNDETTNKPLFTINGMARVTKKVSLVSENWIVNLEVSENDYSDQTVQEYKVFVSYGVRFMWDRFTIDAAFINGYEIVDVFVIGVPYIDFIMRF